MGWFSKVLLPGRLRAGPTALLPARPDQKTLLAVAQLADPEARADGDDIVAGGSRVQPPIELTGDILAKLGVPDEDRLWACRITAEGPLPVDFFDKSLAEGIAYRLGGWSICQGEPLDPAEDGGDLLVYLPAAPEPEEILPLLAGLLGPVEAVDAERWPEGELVDGVVHVPVRGGRVADVYAGDAFVLTVEEGRRIPPAARVRWPYLTEIAVARISPVTRTDETDETDETDAEDAASAETAPEPAPETVPEAAGGADGGAEDAADLVDEDEQVDEDEHVDEDAVREDDARADLLARAAVAVTLANELSGIAADSRGFQLAEPADVLPGRHA
ncbi:hypothetical protein [Microbispora sp. H11081]|uniref:hypothetical protein n=1 Tax=Microbispora sp. H11081 TaxID=2729107 RepID=UPI001472BD56|nr:hypothetical protein [Microbispora sp. H11081]